jgi:hypothetical protein
MTEESLLQFLPRRLRELRHQIAALNSELSAKSAEAQAIVDMMTKLGIAEGAAAMPPLPLNYDSSEVPHLMAEHNRRQMAAVLSQPNQAVPPLPLQYEGMTIKQLAIKALLDHFPNGATTIDLRDFIQDAYGRDIMPSSLRPQLHRLKADGILGQEPSDDRWNFQDGMRFKYELYNHPYSSTELPELKDDLSDEEIAQEIEDAGLLGKVSIEQWRLHRPNIARQRRWYGKPSGRDEKD